MEYNITVPPEKNGSSVGRVLSSLGFSRRLVASLKRTENGILLNGTHARTVDVCKTGDVITLSRPDTASRTASGARPVPNPDLFAEILYEDEFVCVFDKPRGMPVHESASHRGDSLANLFAAKFPELTFRCINRLDLDTCGCVICAKDRHSAKIIGESYEKTYIGECVGCPSPENGLIDEPIARKNASLITREVRADGKPSKTIYKTLEKRENSTLLSFKLLTGRTHQIRVHMSFIGCPLVGDSLYGTALRDEKLQLCCKKVEFHTPESSVCGSPQKAVEVTSKFEI